MKHSLGTEILEPVLIVDAAGPEYIPRGCFGATRVRFMINKTKEEGEMEPCQATKMVLLRFLKRDRDTKTH